MNYTIRRSLISFKKILKFKKDVELSEEQKSFISYWENRLVNENSLFFETKDEFGMIGYEIHNLKDNSYIILRNDYKVGVIELYMVRNDTLVQYFIDVPLEKSNKMMVMFKNEVNKRSQYLKQKFNIQLINDIKKLK